MNLPAHPPHPEYEKENTKGNAWERERKSSRINEQKMAVVLLIAGLLSGCVYHVRGSKSPHVMEYDHKDAVVVFPWRTTEEFDQEYEFKLLASISAWIGWPIEALDGFSRLKFERMFYIIPAIFYALENDREHLDTITEIARQNREEKEQRERGIQTRLGSMAEKK